MHELEILLSRLNKEHLGYLRHRKPAVTDGQKTELPRVPVHGTTTGMKREA